MFHIILFMFMLVTSVQSQYNGEFWWLNSKLNALRKVKPSPPKIDYNDFQNDESGRIIFRDDDLVSNNVLKSITDRTSKLKKYGKPDDNKIVWPTNEHIKNHDTEVFTNQNANEHMKNHDVDVFANKKTNEHMKNHDVEVTNENTNKHLKNHDVEVSANKTINKHMTSHDVQVTAIKNADKESYAKLTKPSKTDVKGEDVLIFTYPKNDTYSTVDINNATTEIPRPTSTQNTPIVYESQKASTAIQSNPYIMLTTTRKNKDSQNICTYVSEEKCYHLNGLVYKYSRRVPTAPGDEHLVCCILPIEPIPKKDDFSHIIRFPTTAANKNRYKRSENEENVGLKQRDILLKRKFSTEKIKPVSTSQSKIVTQPEEDYTDPYWNIKNTKFENLNKPKIENTKYDYYEDYVQEYADEIPKPGLVGLYSDHAKSPSSWSIVSDDKGYSYGDSDDDYEDDSEDGAFGYSTIDPRKGIKKQKQKPTMLTTTSSELNYDAESQTINFQSNPDFQVFQGFKLLNLFRNTSRVHTKKTTNENNKITSGINSGNSDDSEVFHENQLFNSCGNIMLRRATAERGTQIGEAVNGSHPWMALVVLTKRRHNVLCYASLVHPRAAVTVGDCVDGTSPGDITVITGLWDLNDRSRSKTRVATVHVHPQYKPGDVDNNLAILHWMRPLKLSINVQPACVGAPQIGDECKFFGWGGLDQGIQQRSRWQRVSIRKCSGPLSINKRKKTSDEAFCVTAPRVTVTGMGGPLICDVDSHNTIVGVTVSKDNGYILIPVQDWAMQADNLLSGD